MSESGSLLLFTSIYLQATTIVLTTIDGSLGSPNPALFSARTRNSYSTSSVRPVTSKLSSVMDFLDALTHLMPFFSFFSTQ